MQIWVLCACFAVVSCRADLMRVFQGEIVKRVFRQDAAFCFRPLESEGCAGSTTPLLWDEGRWTTDNATVVPKTMAFLFTVKSPDRPEFLHECGLRADTLFDPRHRTEVIVHGYLDGACRSAWMRDMKDELFKRGSYNVILLDWTWGNGPNYTESTNNTRIVGKQLAFILQSIMNETGVGPETFHLVGHSLGAHIAGFAGKDVKNLRRITALDPALTPFQNMSADDRLDATDANLVDVIHTNAGTQPGEALGDINPLGHVDFYPNGGTVQEGCRRNIVKSFLSLDFLYATISLVPRICSHMHAVQYYKASINPKQCEFIGVQCPTHDSFVSGECATCRKDGANCAIMGMNHEYYYSRALDYADRQQPRKFYLNTTLDFPYCDNSGLNFEDTEEESTDL